MSLAEIVRARAVVKVSADPGVITVMSPEMSLTGRAGVVVLELEPAEKETL